MSMVEVIWERVSGMNNHYSLNEVELKSAIALALNLPDYPTILELGVCHGRTLAALTASVESEQYTPYSGWVYGIDHYGLEGNPADVAKSIRDLKIYQFRLIVSDTKTAEWSKPVDMLLIDAGHDEMNVKPDIEKYLPFVKPGGIVLFHDYDDPFDSQSPHWAVRHYADIACAEWEDFGMVGNLKGWRKPGGPVE